MTDCRNTIFDHNYDEGYIIWSSGTVHEAMSLTQQSQAPLLSRRHESLCKTVRDQSKELFLPICPSVTANLEISTLLFMTLATKFESTFWETDGFSTSTAGTYQTLFNEEAKQDGISHFPQILEADSLQFCIFNNILQLMVKKLQDTWNQKRSKKIKSQEPERNLVIITQAHLLPWESRQKVLVMWIRVIRIRTNFSFCLKSTPISNRFAYSKLALNVHKSIVSEHS